MVWTAELFSNYYELLNPQKSHHHEEKENVLENVIAYVSGIAVFSTGIFLAIIRLYEPYFVFLVKKTISMCFCELLDVDPDGIND